MSLIIKKTGLDIPPVEAGTYQAVCYMVVDLGTQHIPQFGKDVRQVLIGWEIPELRIDYEKNGVTTNSPRILSKKYTANLFKRSNLSKDLVAWRGRPFTEEEYEGFDIENVIGANCLLQVINITKDEDVYANIASVMKPMKGMPILKPENPIVKYSIETNGFEFPEGLPDWIVKKVKNSNEYKEHSGLPPQAENPEPENTSDLDDNIPF